MPRPDSGVQTPEINTVGITFIDKEGKTLSQSIKTAGGNSTIGAAQALAEAIADCSNACFKEVRNNEAKKWPVSSMNLFDEAQASAANVIVIVIPHDTDPDKNQEVLIPAYDMSLIDPNGLVVLSDPLIQEVIDAALDVLNDDDNELNPDNYHGENAYAFTTTRKTSGSRRPKALGLPALVESTNTDVPGDEPGNLP